MSTLLYDAAHAALAERLGPGALAHSQATAEAAATLAGRYGVDVEQARLAGLLHDWAREDAPESLLAAAHAAGMDVTAVDQAVPYLLHAKIGAMAVEECFPDVAPEVVRAISRHTVGEAPMSTLDMVVYVADMIEPGRRFEGVERLRELVGEVSLHELYVEAYAASLAHLLRTRKRIHPATVDTWNSMIAGETS